MKKFKLWRRFVRWMRSLALAIAAKTPINWGKKTQDLLDIVNDGVNIQPSSEPKNIEPDFDPRRGRKIFKRRGR